MYDVVIIGSGVAGLTSAIYTSRARLKTLVIAGAAWGGQLMFTTDVENFPGFKDGVQGPELMQNIWKQAEKFGAQLLAKDASSVDFSSRPLKVSAGGVLYESRAVIIATGASPRWLGLENEARLRGRGVSTCSVCDAALYENKRAIVVGGGDSAVEEALALARFASEVKIVHRRDRLRASEILQERVRGESKISFCLDAVVRDILGEQRVEGIRIRNVKTGEESVLPCDAVFLAIGHKPATEIFKDKVELDQSGYVVCREGTRTSVEGVFAAGDAQDRRYRQAVTAAGAGCRAAIDAERYLRGE